MASEHDSSHEDYAGECMFSDGILRPHYELVMCELNDVMTERIKKFLEKLSEYCCKATEIIDTLRCSNIPMRFYTYSRMLRHTNWQDRKGDYKDIQYDDLYRIEEQWADLLDYWHKPRRRLSQYNWHCLLNQV